MVLLEERNMSDLEPLFPALIRNQSYGEPPRLYKGIYFDLARNKKHTALPQTEILYERKPIIGVWPYFNTIIIQYLEFLSEGCGWF